MTPSDWRGLLSPLYLSLFRDRLFFIFSSLSRPRPRFRHSQAFGIGILFKCKSMSPSEDRMSRCFTIDTFYIAAEYSNYSVGRASCNLSFNLLRFYGISATHVYIKKERKKIALLREH
ncbi:hypothetical protein PUN28_008572 [Cardiocondyla obscurior]|uniref:Uncharacterized protein n=1 Tax=Cardiocondyla obscurior TaxID=286306 RepID=A0AAW2FYT5_9HYME